MSSVAICDSASPLRRVLAERVALLPGVERVEVVEDTHALSGRLAHTVPSVVLLSSQLDSKASTVVRSIRRSAPNTRILLLTMGTDPDDVVSGMAAGADGYVARDASVAELAAAFVLLPEQYLARHGERPAPPPNGESGSEMELSDRELQVLEGMSRGRSNSEIGEDLFLSEDTIKTHARRLFRKMSVNDRAHAVAEGFRQGLLG